MKNTQNEIVIDLSRAAHASALPSDQLVQQISLRKLQRLVSSALSESGDSYGQENNVFFIDGTRGAGKTTFLRTAMEVLTLKKATDQPQKRQTQLSKLIHIDPTLIETGEHVFFTILYALRDAVENALKKDDRSENDQRWDEWRKSLQRLARGANLLAHKEQPSFADDQLSLSQGLEHARSGVALVDQFHSLVETAATIVQTKSFLITFDDVDTEFQGGWNILELIRRYLLSPRLIVLITGDLQLYTHLVRNRQFRNLGRVLHEQDGDRADERSRLVDHLEQQYLLKLFPLSNRIRLNPLSKVISDAAARVTQPRFYVLHPKLAAENDDKPKELEELIFEIVRSGFAVTDPPNAVLYKDFLLALPIRALFQVLQLYCESLKTTRKPTVLATALRGTLLGSLYKLGIDIDALAQGDEGKLIEAVFNIVTIDGEFDTGSYLRPQPSSETLRNGFVGLAAEVAANCYMRPDRAIRYMLQAPGSLSLAHLHTPTKNATEIAGFFSTFQKEFSIGRREDALNWARYAAPVLLSPYREGDGYGPGVLKLAGKGRTTSQKNEIAAIQRLAFQIAKHDVMGGATRTYMSVFNIVGVIERLLRLNYRSNISTKNEVQQLMHRLVSTVTISAPSWLAGKDTQGAESHEDPINLSNENLLPEAIKDGVDEITKWVEESKIIAKQIAPSALMLGKIWARLYFSLSRAHGVLRRRRYGVGNTMHINVMCLVNALLVEEYDYGVAASTGMRAKYFMTRGNPTSSSLPIFRKMKDLNSVVSLSTVTPLTYLVLTCPLITAYLVPPEDLLTSESNAEVFSILAGIIGITDREFNAYARGLGSLNDEIITGVRPKNSGTRPQS